MKIVFKDSKIENGIIKVSLDGGFTFTDYEIANVKESGIPLDSSQAFDKIQIKGSANVLKNLDVVSSINTLYESDLLPEDITGIVLKDFNGKFDKSFLQKYPKLTSVTIPEGVTSIGRSAFEGCSKLESIDIPESVTSIDGSAFGDCRNLKTINYEGTEEQWNAINKGANWNNDCPSDIVIKCEPKTVHINLEDVETGLSELKALGDELSKVVISGEGEMPDKIFEDFIGITEVIIEEGVTSIGESAFSGCYNLKSISIPNTVTSIGTQAFCGCTCLASITIPEGVTCADSVFVGCKGLTSFTIPDGWIEIPGNMFFNCTNLKSVTIPNSITKIGNYAFYSPMGSMQLETINYKGSEERWNAIEKDSSNSSLNGATINYNYQV